jgi:hypothetical protein
MSGDEGKIEQVPMSQKIWSWTFVGTISLFLFGGGITFMLSSHAWVADGFFIVGTILLLVKFWTWEDTQQQPPKKQAALLAIATICSFVLLVGVCVWNHHINPSPPPSKVSAATIKSPNDPPSTQEGGSGTIPPAPLAHPPVVVTPKVTIKPVRPTVTTTSTTEATTPVPTPAQQNPAPTYQQQCVGSACAQGQGASATYNQYGAPKLVMTDSQRDSICNAMKSDSGLEFTIFLHDPTEDSTAYAEQLRKALVCAGLMRGQMDGGSGLQFGGVVPPGISALVGTNEMNAISDLAEAMLKAGLLSRNLPVTPNPNVPTQFHITIAPNR